MVASVEENGVTEIKRLMGFNQALKSLWKMDFWVHFLLISP